MVTVFTFIVFCKILNCFVVGGQRKSISCSYSVQYSAQEKVIDLLINARLDSSHLVWTDSVSSSDNDPRDKAADDTDACHCCRLS